MNQITSITLSWMSCIHKKVVTTWYTSTAKQTNTKDSDHWWIDQKWWWLYTMIHIQRHYWFYLQKITMLSIIMPVYKRSEFTKMTIYSIQTQSHWKCELIILIDWNDEKTLENIKNIYENRSMTSNISLRVHVPQKRTYLTNLRNTWIQFAKYDNVIVINDDVLLSDWFDRMICSELIDHRVVCPKYTEGDQPFAEHAKEKRWNIAWRCRAVKKIDRPLLWPIDERLKIRYNDDYIFRKLADMKDSPHWTDKAICHHYRSKTLNSPEEKEHIQDIIKQDEEIRKTILKEQWRFDQRFAHLNK